MMSLPITTGRFTMDDELTATEQRDYEQYVVEYLEDAGVVEPSASSRLVDMDKEKLDYATRQLKYDFDVSFKLDSSMTVRAFARELCKAVKSR